MDEDAPMPMPPEALPPAPYENTDWRSGQDFTQMIRDLLTPQEKNTFDIYLKRNPLSPEAQDRLMMYYRILLSSANIGGNIQTPYDEQTLVDLYLCSKVDLTMGLWRFDINPTFNLIVDLIEFGFRRDLMKARKSNVLKKLMHNTQEFHQYDGRNFSDERQGFMNKLSQFGR
jgi:hypothetical protein